jgi:hypothetical protein
MSGALEPKGVKWRMLLPGCAGRAGRARSRRVLSRRVENYWHPINQARLGVLTASPIISTEYSSLITTEALTYDVPNAHWDGRRITRS